MLICFCHMIKNAGTTLSYIFRNNYGFNYYVTDKKDFAPDDLEKLLSINRNIKTISGHSLRSVTKLDSVCPDLKYITFIRDPIDRYISHYTHGRIRNPHHMSLEERIKIVGERNYQTKFIIGSKNREQRGFIAGEEELVEAKKILANDFAFVGLVEQFDESLILMKKMLNLQDFDLRYQKKNVAPKKIIIKDKLPHNVIDELREANKLDYELYRFVKDELFEKQKQKYGRGFIEELNHFKRSNENYKFKNSQILKYIIGEYFIYKLIFWLSASLSR